MIKLYFILLIFIITGCSTPKFYSELKRVDSNDVIGKDDKKILYLLKNQLPDTYHIIYIFMPDYRAISNEKWTLVYDVTNSKYFNVKYEISDFTINDISHNELKDTYEFFILENFYKR